MLSLMDVELGFLIVIMSASFSDTASRFLTRRHLRPHVHTHTHTHKILHIIYIRLHAHVHARTQLHHPLPPLSLCVSAPCGVHDPQMIAQTHVFYLSGHESNAYRFIYLA
ncbi:hypothetical protein KP509_20G035500 [Ceratopteris richardii]|uniref:Uncharacterized protein n=1 Tax=Ceratopteris richardii TaxID=49495 RepID=A0A8T2SHX4_CERRI|nr:hypothetical protein KP509_20G035500 [Ceratopteris richardii]